MRLKVRELQSQLLSEQDDYNKLKARYDAQ